MTDVLDALPKSHTRTFVPANLDVRRFEDVEPLFRQLLDADLSSVDALKQWLLDRSELETVIQEIAARVHIRTTIDTTSAEYKKAFLDWVEKFQPRLKPLADQLDRKFRDAPARTKLDASYRLYERSILTQLELYRDANVPLETELAKLTNDYDAVQGATVIEFEGKRYTPSGIHKLQLESDRGLRERSWRAAAARRAQDAQKVSELFEMQVRLREQVADNAGCKDYRAYQWKALQRFDYQPEDCLRHADAVEQVVLPSVRRLMERRKRSLGVDSLRPWDVSVDPHNRPPLKPFDQVDELKQGCSRIFHHVSPALGAQFDRMRELNLLDLDSREGKASGGYQASLTESRVPFIFMNAVGVDGDVNTLLHEGGHAFHSFATEDQPLLAYRQAPMEFCEVASMSMELLGGEHNREFYDAQDATRSRTEHLEHVLTLFTGIARGEQFQHWVYTNKGCTPEQRETKWIECWQRFSAGEDWTGLEHVLRNRWQQIGHFFWAPFYFIEYAIAQIGALQVWQNSKRDPVGALAQYRHALALGGTRGLRDLFKEAGLTFGMDAETLKPLVELVEKELAELA